MCCNICILESLGSCGNKSGSCGSFCWSSGRRRARSCGFVKPPRQCKCAFLRCVRGVFVVACLRLRCDVVDARPWRGCSRVRSRFEVSLEYLVVEVLCLL